MKAPRGDELGPGRRCRVTPLGWELLEGYAQGSEVTPGCRDTEQRERWEGDSRCGWRCRQLDSCR